MSFIYPRTITITRPGEQTGVGALGYGAELTSTETPVASGIAASIQLKKEGAPPTADLPGDVAKTPFWVVFIPASAMALGVIQRRDIVTDDLGIRYQVQAPYWNSLGYNLFVQELET